MVAWISLSLSLAMIRSMSDDLAVMTNNSRAVVHLLVCLLTVLGHDILTLLNVGGINNGVIFLMTFLSLIVDWSLMTLLVWLTETLEVVVGLVSVSWLSISFSLSLVIRTTVDKLRVMTNNSRAVVNLLGHLTAVFSDNVSTLLNVGCINNHIILLMTSLLIVGVTFLVVDSVVHNMTFSTGLVMAGN